MMQESKDVNIKNLRTLDVVFCHTTLSRKPITWVQKAIQKFTRSEFDHVAFFVRIEGLPFIVESSLGKGVHLSSWDAWCDKNEYQVEIDRVDVSKTTVKEALRQVGVVKYDVAGIFHQAHYIILGKWKGEKGKEAASRKYCSEYVANVLGLSEWWKLTPVEVRQKISKFAYKIV